MNISQKKQLLDKALKVIDEQVPLDDIHINKTKSDDIAFQKLKVKVKNEIIRFNSLLKNSDKINLELPLKYGTKISGHICQGHVDTVSKVTNITKVDKSLIYEFSINKAFYKYLVEKASILVNGVSLTISKIKRNKFEIWVIPHTLKLTNLVALKKNDLVNIEIDILSKYVKKFINEKK